MVGVPEFSHLDDTGQARMVDISDKEVTGREAVARGAIRMRPDTLRLIGENKIAKGEVFAVARVAAVMAAKGTAGLVPLSHTIPVTGVDVDFRMHTDAGVGFIEIQVAVRTVGRTGAEMEALAGVAVGALTIYDMCKAVDKDMKIDDIRLVNKRGGRSGEFWREGESPWEK